MSITNRSLWKHISDLDSLKSAKLISALIELRGTKGFDALPLMSERVKIKRCQSYWHPS
jgi:hypothetical protein